MEQVAVNKTALEAFIEYADQTRIARDSQFLCSTEEYKRSDAEFAALVAALDVAAGESTGTEQQQ